MAAASSETLKITVAVRGDEAERWVRALRGCDGASAEPVALNTSDDLLEALARDDVAAIAFAGDTGDLAGAVKRALMANRHVFVYGPSAISSKHLLALDALARRRGRVLLFDVEGLGDERAAFLRKTTSGPRAIWRPWYVRSLRTGASSAPLDALAIADIGFVVSLLGMPARVAAVAPRLDDESGAIGVAMLTLLFEGGTAARIDVSLVEPEPRHEVTIACDGRTIVLDAYNARSPLRIEGNARHRTPQLRGESAAWAETIAEHPLADTADRLAGAAAAFVTAARARDAAASNAHELADATRVWERSRASITSGGAPVEVEPAQAERPKLKLIVGGGHVDVSAPAPELTVIGGTRPAAPEHEPDPEPLRTA
jgi:predicted dehydrogenase